MFTGVSDLFRKPVNLLVLQDHHRLDGKKVLITGASSGLGLATAIELAKRGAHVIMAVRSGIPEKGEEVRRKSGSNKVSMVHLDLSDLETVRSFPEKCLREFGTIDILICNAAMVAKSSRKTGWGLDEMFQVNYFAKFLMVNGLIRSGCFNTAGSSLPGIIFVTSESHRNPEGFDWENFGSCKHYGIKKSVYMYGYYKLLLVTLANELSRRLNREDEIRITVSALCPGPVNTKIAREAPGIFQPLLKLVFRLFFRSPEKACRPVIYLAASEEREKRAMDYLFLMQRKDMDPKAVDPGNGKKLWKLTEALASQLGLFTTQMS